MVSKKLARFEQKSSENVWKKCQKYFKNCVRILIKKCPNLVTKNEKSIDFTYKKRGFNFLCNSKVFQKYAQVFAKS